MITAQVVASATFAWLLIESSKNRLVTTDEALRDVIAKIPALQDGGKFSMEKYERVLRAQGMSQPQFEAKLRQDLTMRQLMGTVGDSAFVAQAQADTVMNLQLEERQFNEFRFPAEQFLDKVKLAADAAQKYYDENKAQFEIAEQVKAEFLILSQDAIQSQATVSDAAADLLNRAGGGRGDALRTSIRRRWAAIEACETTPLARARGAEVRVLAFEARRYVGSVIGVHSPAGVRVGTAGRRRNVEHLVLAGPGDVLDAMVDAAGAAHLLPGSGVDADAGEVGDE